MRGSISDIFGSHCSGNAAMSLPEATQAASLTGQESSAKQRRRTERSSSDLALKRDSGPLSNFVA